VTSKLIRMAIGCVLSLLGAFSAFSQNTTTLQGSGPPSGGCAAVLHYVDTTNSKSYDCNNSVWYLIGPGAAGSASFATLTTGTNTSQTLTVGNSSTLTTSGSGVVNANQCNGVSCGTVTNVTGTAPIASSGGGTPAISINTSTFLNTALFSDVTASAATRGDSIFAIGATPTWQRLGHPPSGGYFKWNGTDIVASTGAASGTGSPTSCTNQVVTAFTLAADAAPTSTCTTITNAFTSGTFAATAHNLLSATHGDTVTHTVVLGDLIYGNSTPAWQALTGSTSATKQFLTQTGNGSISAAPAWGTIAAGDLPSGTATAGSGTNNVLAKFSGASSLVNSTITDNGTLISTTEGVSIAPSSTSQVAGILNNPTSTSVDIIEAQVNGTSKALIGKSGDIAGNSLSTGGTTVLAYCGGAGAACYGAAEGAAPTDTTASVERSYPDSTQHVFKDQVNNADFVGREGVLCSNVTPVNVSTNTTSDQNLMVCSIKAGTLNTTLRILKVKAGILYTTPLASSATITTKFKLCSVSGCGSGTVVTLGSFTSSANPGSVTNNSINSQLECTVQTAGASGAFECQFGQMLIDLGASPGLADSVFGTSVSTTVGTIDLTAATFLQTTIAFSVASGSNTASQRQGTTEVAN
jgi:hypothetical protein